MNNYKIIRKSDLSIVFSYSARFPKLFSSTWGNMATHITLQVPNELDPECVKAIVIDEVITLVEDIEASIAKQQLLEQQTWSDIRSKRNLLLSECDWTQLVDCPLSGDKKEQYRHYRQLLRDLPKNTIDVFSIIWPNKP